MIKVDSSFYESGCTMDGKENRVFLKRSDGSVDIEMVFSGNEVKLIGDGTPTPIIHDFCCVERIFVIEVAGVSCPVIGLNYY